VRLGHPDAKNDTHLTDYFIKPDFYNDILEFYKFLIVGRRGTGKTAIIRQLSNDLSSSQQNKILKIDSFMGLDQFIKKWNDYKIGVLNFIGSEMAYFLNDDEVFSKNVTRKYKSLVRDLKLSRVTGLRRVRSRITEFGHNRIGKLVISKDNANDDLPYYSREFRKFLQEVQIILESQNMNLTILIDELDQLEGEDYIPIVESLIQFGYDRLSEDSKVKCLVFLRRDVIELMSNFHLLPQISMNIAWLDEFWDESNLRSLISIRINVSSQGKINFDNVYPERDIVKIRGQSYSWDYMMQRTFFRPREIIRFTQHLYDELNKIGFNNKKYKNEYYKIILTAEKKYSRDLRNEINTEHNQRFQIIYNEDSLATYLIGIFQGMKEKTNHQDVINKLSSIKFIKDDDIMTEEEAIRELFTIGVIGMDLPQRRSHEGFYHYNPQLINQLDNYISQGDVKWILHHGLRFNLLPNYGSTIR
jgi:GTPase SAR1 family protein